MAKAKKFDNPIVERIASVNADLAKSLDNAPVDPDEFLSWARSQFLECRECPLSDTRNFVVEPDGTAAAQIMVVGEGPGFLEDLTKVPMVGPLELKGSHCSICSNSGSCFGARLLETPFRWGGKRKSVTCEESPTDSITLPERFYLKSAGAIIDGILLKCWEGKFPRHNWNKIFDAGESPFFFTNSTLCRSWDNITLLDSTPTNAQRMACRKWLLMQWAAVNPKIIIALGRAALGSILKNDSKADTVKVNDIIQTPLGPVIFQYHPAFYMRQPEKAKKAMGFGKIQNTFERALEFCELL